MKIKLQDVLNFLCRNRYKTFQELNMLCDLTYGVTISYLYHSALTALDYHMDLCDIIQLSVTDMIHILDSKCEDYFYNHLANSVPEKISFEI